MQIYVTFLALNISAHNGMIYFIRLYKKLCLSCITCYQFLQHTGRFIMFSIIINIYNKKTKGPTLMEFFTATGKLKKFSFLPHTLQHIDACVARTWISYRCVPCYPCCTHRTSL